MSETVDAARLAEHVMELLERVVAGERSIILWEGRPVAELCPHSGPAEHPLLEKREEGATG